ncbi:MAG: RNA polymerase sigma-54 factor [Gemmatales bacterium]|nr:MAG: RNA polymerase sigma-54 factor [Gemmatales bacterium]
MRLDTHLSQKLEQRMILAPRMIQSMEILQLPIMALQERIEQELQENPVLELRETQDEDLPAEFEHQEAGENDYDPDDPTAELIVDDNNEFDFERLDALSRDWEELREEDHRPSRNGLEELSDKRHDAMQNMPSRPPSLQDYLNEQLTFLDLEPVELERVRFLISHIDDSGFLRTPLEELANSDYARSLDPPPTVEDLEAALAIIHKLDPPGVGARDVKECLLLQLTPEIPHREIVRTLIVNHLDDIRHNRLPVIQRRTGFDLQTIKEAIDVLRHLNLRPGSQFTPDNTQYVVPDIIVERNENGDYDVRLVDDWVPNVYISKRYLDLYRDKGADPKAKEYLKRKIQAAQWLLESIEQRRNTLEKVARAIVQHQRAFLDKGPEYIEPLKMQQIADQVGVHVTTVSRAVDDKWVQTPRGIFPLKRFFGGGTQTASGKEVAWETIRQKLLEMIENEDKSNPLSDEELTEKMQQAGYPLKRRTVTKYRKTLKIPSSRERKDWTIAASKNNKMQQATAAPPDSTAGAITADDTAAPVAETRMGQNEANDGGTIVPATDSPPVPAVPLASSVGNDVPDTGSARPAHPLPFPEQLNHQIDRKPPFTEETTGN